MVQTETITAADLQVKYCKKQLFWTRLAALCCLGVLVLCIVCTCTLMPQVQTAIASIDVISTELSKVDWAEMAANMDTLMKTTNQSLSALDIAEFNKAITDLRTVIGPLVQLFGGAQ